MSKTGKTDEKGIRFKFVLKIQFGLGCFDSNPIRPDLRMYLIRHKTIFSMKVVPKSPPTRGILRPEG